MIIKDLMKEISQGKNLEKNIPIYFNELMTLNSNAANYSMTFHYYTFVEMMSDIDYSDVEGFGEAYDVVSKCIDACVKDDIPVAKLNENIKSLDTVRETVIKNMKVLTAYTDVFQIYEYILNRLEGKYTGKRYVADDTELVAAVMQYIFADNDNMAVNAKIQEIIGQLPVRMTKVRFLDLLRNSLSVYRGSDRTSVETFLYMVRTGATLERPEGYDSIYPKLVEYKQIFDKADYKNLSKEEYDSLKRMLEDASNQLEHIAGAFYSLQEVINDVYTILLSKPYANMPGTISMFAKDMQYCSEIIGALNEMKLGETFKIPENITSLLCKLEGKQERVLELRNTADSIFYDVKVNQEQLIESMMLTQVANCLDLIMKLQSNSIFVELDVNAVSDLADDLYMKRTEKELIAEFDQLLSSSSQVVMRAIMGNVLSKLPVFFNNQQEVSDYITSAISGCKDEVEKSACVQLIAEIVR